MKRPWFYDELALTIGLSILGESRKAIGLRLDRPQSEIMDVLWQVHESRLIKNWSQLVITTRLRDREDAERAEEQAWLEANPVPRIPEPTETPKPLVKRRFKRVPICAQPKCPPTSVLMGDPPPNRSALSQKPEGKIYGTYSYTPRVIPVSCTNTEDADKGGGRKQVSKKRQGCARADRDRTAARSA